MPDAPNTPLAPPAGGSISASTRRRLPGPVVTVLRVAGGSALVAMGMLQGCVQRGGARTADPGPGPLLERRAGGAADGALDVSGRVVRVALAEGAARATVGGTGEWRLYDADGRAVLARSRDGAGWTVERQGSLLRAIGPSGEASTWRAGPLVARPVGMGALLVHGGKRWRGELRLHAADGGRGVTVVNALPIEDYLRGVVPLELAAFAPQEGAALEAQAVAARSYTYSRLAEWLPRAAAEAQARRPWDVRATVADQVYGGADAERPAADRAVRATEGLVLRFGGTVVSAPYYSACGGATVAARDAFRSESEPYLASVSDRIPGTDRHYCDGAPRFHWTREWDGEALQGVMERYLRRYASGDAARAAGAPVGTVRALTIQERTEGGRVASLAVSTDGGRFVLRGNAVRYALRSVGGEILPSTYFSVEAGGDGDGRVTRLTVRGNGNGHGVGMCQWGAIGRARAGQDFRSILRTYYPGTTIEPAE